MEYDAMEASVSAHFSGLRLDGLVSSSTPSRRQRFLIGVSGGTASGKTTVCDKIIQQLHDHRVVLVNQDSFYRGLTAEELERAHDYNFDHPDAFDTEQLLDCMAKLKDGQSVNVPIYDFKTHQRCSDSFRKVNASDVIILEGILVFHDEQVRDMMNMKIFVDTDDDVRLARRIRRDTVERGRDINTYAKFVKPAFDEFILPSKKYADVIIPKGGDNHVAIDLIVQHIRTKLGQHNLCKIYPNVHVVQSTFQIRGMHTLIRDQEISKHDFVFYSDRLIRLVVEHGLGYLPFTKKEVLTPTDCIICCSGESMENALRACCKGIKIGKILIHRDGDNGKQRLAVFFSLLLVSHETSLFMRSFPKTFLNVESCCLIQFSVQEILQIRLLNFSYRKVNLPCVYFLWLDSSLIHFVTLQAPEGIHTVCKRFPSLKIVTSEIDATLNEDYRVIPGLGEFGDRYFGTDN
ncbi:Uridine kinase-like protein 1 [Nymphaea thermarum]|nr:Uridine kinase-like protein 1 [Nymphaea thermarum]